MQEQHMRSVGLSLQAQAQAATEALTRRLFVMGAGFSRGNGHLSARGYAHSVLVVCIRGSGWAEIGPGRHRVPAGTTLVVPPHVPHSYGPGPDPWTNWWCALKGTDVQELVRGAGATVAEPVVPLRNIDRLVALIDEMIAGYERDLSRSRVLEASGAAWRLLTAMTADRLVPERGRPLERAMDHLARHLDVEVGVADVAGLVGVSPSYLTALFHASTGGGVRAYHIALRMAEARRLLETTTSAIADVARSVGYSDAYYFSRHFRRHNGMSPTEWRRDRPW
jgi:AraC family transcriptional regulator of arabinose operon